MTDTPDFIQPSIPKKDSAFTKFLKNFKKTTPAPVTPSVPLASETPPPKLNRETQEDQIRRELAEETPIRQECLANIHWPTQLPENSFQQSQEHLKMISDLVHNALLQEARNAGIDASIPPFPFLASEYGEY